MLLKYSFRDSVVFLHLYCLWREFRGHFKRFSMLQLLSRKCRPSTSKVLITLLAYFLTSAHLDNHCVKCACLADGQFQRVTASLCFSWCMSDHLIVSETSSLHSSELCAFINNLHAYSRFYLYIFFFVEFLRIHLAPVLLIFLLIDINIINITCCARTLTCQPAFLQHPLKFPSSQIPSALYMRWQHYTLANFYPLILHIYFSDVLCIWIKSTTNSSCWGIYFAHLATAYQREKLVCLLVCPWVCFHSWWLFDQKDKWMLAYWFSTWQLSQGGK